MVLFGKSASCIFLYAVYFITYEILIKYIFKPSHKCILTFVIAVNIVTSGTFLKHMRKYHVR